MHILLKKIQYYDPYHPRSHSTTNKYLNGALRYLGDEAASSGKDFSPKEWKLISTDKNNVPKQTNAYDCGVFTIMMADFLTDNLPFEFSQEHMLWFRKKICANILKQSSLGKTSYPIYKNLTGSSNITWRGIKNIGNTCYLAAIVHLLSNCEPLMSHLCEEVGEIVAAFYELASQLYKEELNPQRLREALQYIDLVQMDAYEAIIDILGAIFESFPACETLFKSEKVKFITCNKCNTKTSRTDISNEIILPIREEDILEPIKLEAILENYLSGDGKVQYKCEEESCLDKEFVEEYNSYEELILVGNLILIVLARFNNAGEKIKKKVIIPDKIDILERSFRLVGVVNHHGDSLLTGHYTADVYKADHNQWLHANDSNVAERFLSPASREELASDLPYLILYQEILVANTY